MDYGILRAYFPEWGLHELKQLNRRERRYWIQYGEWVVEQRRQMKTGNGISI